MILIPSIIGQITDFFAIMLLFWNLLLIQPALANRRNVSLTLLCGVIFSVIDLWFNPASDFLSIIIYCGLFKFPRQTSWSNKLLWYLMAFSIQVTAIGIASYATVQLVPINELKQPLMATAFIAIYAFGSYFADLCLTLIGRRLFKIIARKVDFNSPYIRKTILVIALVWAFTLATGIFIFRTTGHQTDLWFAYITFLLLLFILAIASLALYISGYSRSIAEQQQIEKITENEKYVRELERQNTELRKFKHDYKNMLLSLMTLADDQQGGAVTANIQKLLHQAKVDPTNGQQQLNNANLYQIKDQLIRGIIINKLITAKDQGVRTVVEIDSKIEDLHGLSTTITRILGILFDNAIEATLPTDKPELRFAFLKSTETYELVIQNHIATENLNVEKIFNAGYSSKQQHSGLGLATVHELVASNAALFLQTTAKDYQFTTILTIEMERI